MWFTPLFTGLRERCRQPPGASRAQAELAAADPAARLSYPPVDPGLPARPVDDILQPHEDLMRRIKLSYGADQETFSRDLMTVVHRYARYVHLLPATPDNFFSSPGGLLRMGLEIAFYSLQATDGQIFSGRSTITNRRQLEPRWRHATFIAGLCSELHRTLSHVIVTDGHGNEWPPFLMPITDWLQDRRADRFFLRWIPRAHETRSLGVFALPHIVPAAILQHLAHGNAIVVPHLLASISGIPVYKEHNILDELVRHAAAMVIDRDLRASADRYGKPQRGAHLERYLVDALRRLAFSNSAWTPNGERSRVWHGRDGLYLVWPQAATDMLRLLEVERLPGIPKSPETILEILADAEVIEPRGATQATWLIYPPGVKTPIEAVKLSSPAILLAARATPAEPLPRVLAQRASTAAPAPAPPPDSGPTSDNGLAAQQPLPEIHSQEDDATEGPRAPDSAQPCPERDHARTVPDRPHPAATLSGASALSLTAPLQLNPAIASALADIVDTLNHEEKPACCRVPIGLFIPLTELERRRIDTATAIRALSDLSMLANPDPDGVKTVTVTHAFDGDQRLGIVIAHRYIAGFDPADAAFSGPGASVADAGPSV